MSRAIRICSIPALLALATTLAIGSEPENLTPSLATQPTLTLEGAKRVAAAAVAYARSHGAQAVKAPATAATEKP